VITDEVELIVTGCDIADAERAIRASDYPSPAFLAQLKTPIPPSVILADARRRRFAD
jgi:hypothetical protein